MYKTLQTARLRIRPIRPSDAGFILELLNSQGWLQYIGDRNIHTSEQARAYIEKIVADPKRFYSVIEVKPSLEAIGIVSFIFRSEFACPDLGYALLPRFEKMGYAEEASRCYLNELLQEGLHPKIIAITNPENQKSVRLLEKLGFSYETTQADENGTLAIFGLNLG